MAIELKEIGREVKRRYQLVTGDGDQDLRVVKKNKNEIVVEVTSFELVD
jgi:hypothetical protein